MDICLKGTFSNVSGNLINETNAWRQNCLRNQLKISVSLFEARERKSIQNVEFYKSNPFIFQSSGKKNGETREKNEKVNVQNYSLQYWVLLSFFCQLQGPFIVLSIYFLKAFSLDIFLVFNVTMLNVFLIYGYLAFPLPGWKCFPVLD